jgi:hypothetical protein
VEAAYITNPVEERFLRQESFQMKFIQAIVTALKKFMPLLAIREESGGVKLVRAKRQESGG